MTHVGVLDSVAAVIDQVVQNPLKKVTPRLLPQPNWQLLLPLVAQGSIVGYCDALYPSPEGASGSIGARGTVRVNPMSIQRDRRFEMSKTTGKKAASNASKVLANPKSTKAEKSAAGSALVQRESKGKSQSKKK